MIKYLVIFFLLFSTNAYAQQGKGCSKPYNAQYSHQDFTNQKFVNRPPAQFNDTCIKGSNFYQVWEEGDVNVRKKVFPEDMVNVQFIRNNLNNVKIKMTNGHIVPTTGKKKNTRERIKIQNDWRLWFLDSNDEPTEPLEKERMEARGMNVDPLLLPSVKRTPEEQEPYEAIFDSDPDDNGCDEGCTPIIP